MAAEYSFTSNEISEIELYANIDGYIDAYCVSCTGIDPAGHYVPHLLIACVESHRMTDLVEQVLEHIELHHR